MFQYSDVFSGFAVHNLAIAKRFYGETLGMPVSSASSHRGGLPEGAEPDLLRIEIGGGKSLLVYAKPAHVPASFTILNFVVDDITQAVDELTNRGITFERYPGMTFDARGIHRGDVHPVTPVAWFKDPSRNILSVSEAA